MAFTAHDAAQTRFRGTRYAYDRREVERFRDLVVAALQAHEATLAATERRIGELERTQVKGPRFRSRALASGAHEVVPVDAETAGPDEAVPASFDVWRMSMSAAAESDAVRRLAAEEARMIRAVASEQAADQIAKLTAQARAHALQVTQRAASLATRTEEAARERVGKMIESAAVPGSDGEAKALNRRMLELRSTIEVVQQRLEALAPGADAASTDVISLDLRDEGELVEPTGPPRKRRRARGKGRFPKAEDLAAKMLELESRLEPR